MSLDDAWFSEVSENSGSAFSLRINAKLHEEQTDYQKIEIYETEKFGNLMVIDGCIMLSTRDNFIYHEMMSHPVLFSHPEPKRVIIIGGGDCGTLQQVLRHDVVQQAWQIEIDERVTRLSEQYFPELCADNADPRAELKFIDGIKWVADQADASVDVIIIDSTDPIGPAEGLFSETFYRQCHRILGSGGYIVQQSESPLIHQTLLGQMRQAMSKAGFHDIASLTFPQAVYPSGWWSATLACKDQPVQFARQGQCEAKAFETTYYNAEIHQAAFAATESLKALFKKYA